MVFGHEIVFHNLILVGIFVAYAHRIEGVMI